MSRGKYLSLEEARESERLNRFADEHPVEGSRQRALYAVLSAMVGQREARH